MIPKMHRDWNMKIFELHEKENTKTIYSFKSYADNNGETLWGQGTVQANGLTKGGYIEVEVVTNEPDDSFIGKKFYVTGDATPDGTTLYQLFSDIGITSAGIYVTITEVEEEQDEETYDVELTVTDGENPIEGADVYYGE